jgi:hypothetical protein
MSLTKTRIELDRHATTNDWIVKILADVTRGNTVVLAQGSAADLDVAASWCLRNINIEIERARMLLVDIGGSGSPDMLKRMTPAPHKGDSK